jgi:hypothetical protein
MTQKKLNKKLVVVTNQSGLTESEMVQDSIDKVKAQEEFPTIVPGITPTAIEVQIIITDTQKNINDRNLLLEEARAKTEVINNDIEKLKNIFVDKWAKQIQGTAGIDVAKVKQLKFGVKGIYDGQAEPSVTFANSNPFITEVNASRHLVHTLTIFNNVTGNIALPEDVMGTDVFMFIGKDEPADFRKSCIYLGRAKKGKITHKFSEDQMGSMVWYYVIYVPRKASSVPEVASNKKTVVA